jgi:mannitol-1-/sugar-/sorbitol-6-phosphatase
VNGGPGALTAVGRYLAILFDVDGVLVDSQRESDDAMAAWARRHGLDVAEVARWARGRRDVEVARHFVPRADAAAEATAILRGELDRAARVVPCAGAQRVLGSLPDAAWAAVTSAPRALAEARLRACALPLPRVLVTAETVARGKPDPDGYLDAARRLGAPPGRCLVAEDSEVGMAAARAAGAAVLAIAGRERRLAGTTASAPSLAHVHVRRAGRELEVLIGSGELRAPRSTRRS